MTQLNIKFKVAGLVPVNRDVFEIVISCQQRQKIVLNQLTMPLQNKNCLFIGQKHITVCMMPKYPVLLVIHIMYGLPLSVTSFKNVEPRNNKCVRWKSGRRIRTGTA